MEMCKLANSDLGIDEMCKLKSMKESIVEFTLQFVDDLLVGLLLLLNMIGSTFKAERTRNAI